MLHLLDHIGWMILALSVAGCGAPADASNDLDASADTATAADTATGAETIDSEVGPAGDGAHACGPDARPNDGSGCWADSSNTGYAHAPDYPGSLTDFPINKGT